MDQDIHVRQENTPILDGLSVTYEGAGRLHLKFQETLEHGLVRRLYIAIPLFDSSNNIIDIVHQMHFREEFYNKSTEESLECQDNQLHQL